MIDSSPPDRSPNRSSNEFHADVVRSFLKNRVLIGRHNIFQECVLVALNKFIERKQFEAALDYANGVFAGVTEIVEKTPVLSERTITPAHMYQHTEKIGSMMQEVMDGLKSSENDSWEAAFFDRISSYMRTCDPEYMGMLSQSEFYPFRDQTTEVPYVLERRATFLLGAADILGPYHVAIGSQPQLN